MAPVNENNVREAEKRNSAIRSMLADSSVAIVALKKSVSHMKKSEKSLKGFPEAKEIGHYVEEVEAILDRFAKDCRTLNDEADDLQLGIFNLKFQRRGERNGSGDETGDA